VPSESVNEATRADWRELGFFYDLDQTKQLWRLVGSRDGLLAFATLIDAYVADPRNALESEHEHYGPYMYLEIMTSRQPMIDGHAIQGSLADLRRLAELVRHKLSRARVGDSVEIAKDYAPHASFSLRFDVREDGFDAAAADPLLSRTG
jgi:hypothetical protein